MPGRDYYLDDDDTRRYSDAYVTYMIELAAALGADEEVARQEMTSAFRFEKEMALVRMLEY